jgi:hypothetical protein
MKNDLLSQALKLSDEFPVFPCNSKKQPVCAGGFKAATQDPEILTKLFTNPNAALIGMPTGSISGISVVDIDVRDGKAGEQWMNNNKAELGLTKIVQTQSGGWHYYYRHVVGITNTAGIAQCVDIRGEGGYVIVPPSIGYRFLNDEELIAFPKFLIGEKVQGISSPNDTEKCTDAFGAITDGREKYMSDLVYATVMNYRADHQSLPTEEWMVTNVWPTYVMKVKSRGGDLDAEDRGITMFLKKVRSTVGKMVREGFDVRGEFDDPDPVVPIPDFIGETNDDGSHKYRITWYDPSDLKKMPPPKYLIAPYLLEQSFAVLFGAPASYKSFLALDWALSIAHGVDWNGRAVEQGKVIYLAMEGQSGLIQRMDAWHHDNGLQLEDANITCAVMPLSLADEMTPTSDINEMITSLDARLGGEMPKLIIVDTLARSFTGKDENSAIDMGIFVRNVDILKNHYSCTVMAVHHSGKDTDKGMRGSSALRGAVDSEFEIKRKSDTMSVCLSVKKQKDSEEAEPLWMDAREVSWLESAFGVERTSLVLDPADTPPPPTPKKKTSDAQLIALNILQDMLDSDTILEKDFRGNYGVPENYWRDQVQASLPELGNGSNERQNWYKFKDRLLKAKNITIINNLVNICHAK